MEMRRYVLCGWASLLLITASGCTAWRAEEYDARLESAENNAATARLRADQVCYRIDLVEQTANEALRRATQAQDEMQQLAAVVALMLATGRALEAFSVRHAERELRALIDRAPQRAWVQEQDGLHEVAVDQVRPGQTVPVRLQSPQATLDEAALTGESLPVTRHCGEPVASGVCNAGAPMVLVATQTAAQSTYAGIVSLAEAARQSRAPFVRLALENAVSVASILLLTEATITDIPEKTAPLMQPPMPE
ncbi:hypothetical protein O999_11105 [Pseudomonas putida LF54]|jgi:cation transport ATPase|nr:hypothetical protein O999_11105 [Pseudomonas putida LF54]